MIGILITRNFYYQLMNLYVALENSLPVLHQQIIDDSSGHLESVIISWRKRENSAWRISFELSSTFTWIVTLHVLI